MTLRDIVLQVKPEKIEKIGSNERVLVLRRSQSRTIAVYVKYGEHIHVTFYEKIFDRETEIKLELPEEEVNKLGEFILKVADRVEDPSSVLRLGNVTVYPRYTAGYVGLGVMCRGQEWQVEGVGKAMLYAVASLFLPVKIRVRLQDDGCHNLEVEIGSKIIYLRPYINELAQLFSGEAPVLDNEFYILVADLFKYGIFQKVELCHYFKKWRVVAPPSNIKIYARDRYTGTIEVDLDDRVVIIRQEQHRLTIEEVPKNRRAELDSGAVCKLVDCSHEEFLQLYTYLKGIASRKKVKVMFQEDVIRVSGKKNEVLNLVGLAKIRTIKSGRNIYTNIIRWGTETVEIIICRSKDKCQK